MTRWNDVRAVMEDTLDGLSPKEIAAKRAWSMRKTYRLMDEAKQMMGAPTWAAAVGRWAQGPRRPRRRLVDPTDPMGLA